jgi:hypothetical protein
MSALSTGVDPANRQVEITAFDSALVRTSAPVHGKTNDHQGPVIRGITFTQYAYRALEVEGKKQFTANDEPTDEPVGPSDPATFGKEVTGTVLDNVTISYTSRVAGYFRGDGLVIRNTLVTPAPKASMSSFQRTCWSQRIQRNNTAACSYSRRQRSSTRRITFRDNIIDQ